MTSSEIRERFLSYFERKGHKRVPSASVIPWGDPTLMFTNAGMNQFKDTFLGREQRDYVRATTCQKCIRAGGKHNDLDEVGRTTRHATFLEMLGNFSFGDYFKKEVIPFAWEFITEELGFPPDNLYVSVYTTDDEAAAIWRDEVGVPEERILRFGNIEEGDEENFWSMGPVGPCGPCTEIFVDRGPDYGPDDPYVDLTTGDGARFLEIWNLVFMQYNRDESGTLTPLPNPSIDTGLGLERMAMIMQGEDTIFESDILGTLIKRVEKYTGKTFDKKAGMPFRVAADHVRTLTFAIADGALPSNEGRGYVLRRILRRASRFLRELDMHEPLLYRLVGDVVDLMGDAYPEIGERADYISMVIKSEEERFLKTLDQGVDLFEKLAADVEAGSGRVIAGDDAFKLYDTYGFPVDLTRIMAEEKGLTVDMAGFEQAMEQQRERAREASSFAAAADSGEPWTHLGDPGDRGSEFVGYDQSEVASDLLRWRAGAKGAVELVFAKTPFYAMSGGQVSDQGTIGTADGSVVLNVTDVRELPDAGRVHTCKAVTGTFSPEAFAKGAKLVINSAERQNTQRNHTATHLLQAGLQTVLGEHVRQSGSFVDSERLRFDFNHFAAVTPEELEKVERFAAEAIMADYEVDITLKTLDEARAEGAMSLFDEKYGDTVRVITIGDEKGIVSKELCGGTHVKRTGHIGGFRIVSESSVAAGIRRIEAVTGFHAWDMAAEDRKVLRDVSRSLNVTPDQALSQIERLQGTIRDLQKENKRLKTEGGFGGGTDILAGAVDVDGFKVAAGRMEVDSADDLKVMADQIRSKIGSGVGVLGSDIGGKVTIVVTVTDDLIKGRSLKAGDIVKKIAAMVGGSGGGRPHMAMAGGKDAAKLDDALAAVPEVIGDMLKG